MASEIERKFLVISDAWRDGQAGAPMRQGYLAVTERSAVRVRAEGDAAFLNIKQATLDIQRHEFEYPIPLADANHMLDHMCVGHLIEKTRYKVNHAGFTWEIDVFHGVNEGLVVAEIELTSPDQPFECPPWVGAEVSGDARYLNSSLSQTPYSQWMRNGPHDRF